VPFGLNTERRSWITADEARAWFDLLRFGPDRQALEVACGSGGVTCAMASHTGAQCVGVDINVTDAVASVSGTWREARAKRIEQLVALEGGDAFEGLQRFLASVHTLARERRLSRYVYLAEKPETQP
jgi:precorrin-6B methylase 2